ncbi:MAG TPA: hypothetical protein VND93_20465 [Myxococcales bacterium]|nr:hypothetical protein [Myxococcales bacterium]
MTTRLPFLVSWLVLLCFPPSALAAGTARWISMDAPETLEAPVIGLQRTALSLPGGFAVDTSLLADAGLLPNAGVRWAISAGPHRFVAGARYAYFVGGDAYSAAVNALQPVVKRYDPSFSGPSAYAVYGLSLGQFTFGAELRARLMYFTSGSATAGVALALTDAWSLVAEAGVRYLQGEQFVTQGAIQPKLAAGIRLAGKGFGFILGADYVGIDDPMFPAVPVAPVVDLSWSFQ